GMHGVVRARLTPAPTFTFPCMPGTQKSHGRARPWLRSMRLTPAALFLRRLRQIERLVGQRVQVVDHVGALAFAREARELHRGARDVAARIGEELVELVPGPGAALRLHGSRIIEPRLCIALPADDAPQVGTDLVRAALLERMAGEADLGGSLAALRIRLRQRHLDRLL